ncbi:MAG: putative methyltransferase [Deltaproteobacteria bacterium]|nr:putative methyltransferase [Deltaproteobacteria bacterium]
MIARGWWPLQRWLAARPVLAIPLACAPITTLVGLWRPPAELWPSALAAAVVLLAPVVIARGDGSRRRLAGRATGAAMAIALPLVLAALLVDVRLLIPIAAALAMAVLLPAVLPLRAPAADAELASESGSTRARWLVPLVVLTTLGVVIAIRSGVRFAVPDLDANMVTTIAGCAAFWFAISMRPLLGLAIAAATVLALAMSASSIAAASPITVALALPTPLAVWFQRESAGGFPAWTPAVIALATAAAYAADPAGPVMMVVAVLTWLVAATYPAHASIAHPDERSRAGIIAWSQRVFAGLEPYWRFYARAKLAQDPIYDRLAGEDRTWGRVLDAGSGPGLTAVLAAGRGDTTAYLGIDLDVDKLLVARRALRLSGRGLGDMWRLRRERLPLANPPPERFDTILVIDVLHYWPDDVQAATLAQLASLLQDDGRLYLREAVAGADTDAGHVERGERFTTFFGLNPENALTFLSTAQIAALIAGSGLAVESEEPMGGENRLWVCRRS